MIQLKIDEKAKEAEREYVRLIKEKGIDVKAKNHLMAILNDFSPSKGAFEWVYEVNGKETAETINYSDVERYIILLHNSYDSLLTVSGNFKSYISQFNTIISKDYINCDIRQQGSSKIEDSLAKRIINAMEYKKIRDKVYPFAIKELEIKTCVYCNANYTITDKNGEGYYDLDHWKPKSIYPYLCTSFYNLQPSCPSCNRRKSDDDKSEFFHLWADSNSSDLEVLRFQIDNGSVVNYWISGKKEDIEINLEAANPKYQQLKDDTENKLHINARYKEHRDVAEEIIWKRQIYNQAFIDGLKWLDNQSVIDKNRFILGTYSEEKYIHKRPLTKMIQDVAKEIGLI